MGSKGTDLWLVFSNIEHRQQKIPSLNDLKCLEDFLKTKLSSAYDTVGMLTLWVKITFSQKFK